MFSVTHFRSEFIYQGTATIIRKVTMVQFMLVMVLTGTGVGIFNAPLWMAPFFIITGYVAGYNHNGEVVLKRLAAYLIVWVRQFIGMPQIVNVQAEWDTVRGRAEQQQIRGALTATVIVE